MRFNYNGAEHQIDFKREHKEVTIQATGKIVQSTHPYTTVTISQWFDDGVVKGWKTIRTATVGTFSGDKFTHEGGRLNALRLVSKSMTNEKGFKKAIWKAYTTRTRTSK